MFNRLTKLFLLLIFAVTITAQTKPEVGIEEQLGDFLPMELEFINSTGDTVTLKDIINKPFILNLVYYDCPGICSPLLGELADITNQIKLEPGEDFQILTVSFDHTETTEFARKFKNRYYGIVKRDLGENDWLFMTGDSINVKKLTDAAGFYYKYEAADTGRGDYIHAGAIIAVSPEGKLSRYLFGTQFNPFDVKLALIDANAGKTNPTISKFLQYCFSYDPDGRTYALNITRIIGTVMLLGVGIFFIVLISRKKKKK